MKRLLFFIVLAILLPTANLYAAERVCVCYYPSGEYTDTCERFTDPDGHEFDNAIECEEYCNSNFGGVNNTDFAEDAESEYAENMSGECLRVAAESAAEHEAVAAEEEAAEAASAAASSTSTTPRELLKPILSIDIPTVTFSDGLIEDGVLKVNYLGDYISGVYVYLLGISTTIAIVMIMISGLQWTLGGTSAEAIGKAKSRIKNAVTGLVLLLSGYVILFTVNPNLIKLQFPGLDMVEQIALDRATSGDEGIVGTANRASCNSIVETAKTKGSCKISQSVTSPTGNQPICGQHHWFDAGAGGDYKKIINLDYAAGWGSSIRAPFDGTVTYKISTTTSNRCGNTITLTGTGEASGAKISICHAKDFLDDSGTYIKSRTVKQGDILGHVGGDCCAGEKPPSDWTSAKKGWCDVSGTACSDPTKKESCTCQPVVQSGNTSGPHVHITWDIAAGDLLSCIAY